MGDRLPERSFGPGHYWLIIKPGHKRQQPPPQTLNEHRFLTVCSESDGTYMISTN